MAPVATTCGECGECKECGRKRFQASVLDYQFGGHNISEVLAMSMTEAREFFGPAGSARQRRTKS